MCARSPRRTLLSEPLAIVARRQPSDPGKHLRNDAGSLYPHSMQLHQSTWLGWLGKSLPSGLSRGWRRACERRSSRREEGFAIASPSPDQTRGGWACAGRRVNSERRQRKLIDKLLTFRKIQSNCLASRKMVHPAMVASIASPIVRSALTAVEPTAHLLYDLNPPKSPEGPAQPFEKTRFAEGKSLDFPSPGLDFPSLSLGFSFRWLGFSFPRFAQKENSARQRRRPRKDQ